MEIKHNAETHVLSTNTHYFMSLNRKGSRKHIFGMSPKLSWSVATDGMLAKYLSIICGNDDEAKTAK